MTWHLLLFVIRGKFGVVFRALEKKTGRKFAAKYITTARKEDREDVEREVDIMKNLQHKRLLQLYDAFDDGKKEMVLVLELIEGGELFERVICDDFILTERACSIFVKQICEGTEYMHSQNIVHLDMKVSLSTFNDWVTPSFRFGSSFIYAFRIKEEKLEGEGLEILIYLESLIVVTPIISDLRFSVGTFHYFRLSHSLLTVMMARVEWIGRTDLPICWDKSSILTWVILLCHLAAWCHWKIWIRMFCWLPEMRINH